MKTFSDPGDSGFPGRPRPVAEVYRSRSHDNRRLSGLAWKIISAYLSVQRMGIEILYYAHDRAQLDASLSGFQSTSSTTDASAGLFKTQFVQIGLVDYFPLGVSRRQLLPPEAEP